jgi:hypothetical protein
MAIAQVLNVPSLLEDCIDHCLACHAICERTARHCLAMGGDHASVEHQTTLLDCRQICLTSADFMIRESPMHPEVCRACAIACTRCEDACRRMAGGDTMMLRCADACQVCAESCRKMSQ